MVQGAGFAFIGPARQAFIGDLVDRNAIGNAVVLQQLSMNSTRSLALRPPAPSSGSPSSAWPASISSPHSASSSRRSPCSRLPPGYLKPRENKVSLMADPRRWRALREEPAVDRPPHPHFVRRHHGLASPTSRSCPRWRRRSSTLAAADSAFSSRSAPSAQSSPPSSWPHTPKTSACGPPSRSSPSPLAAPLSASASHRTSGSASSPWRPSAVSPAASRA
ncbi:MAG: MFS transporter [Dehalococcoidia bacterium]|nr:MFS transporter [Dehalococcoidia bacterium]